MSRVARLAGLLLAVTALLGPAGPAAATSAAATDSAAASDSAGTDSAGTAVLEHADRVLVVGVPGLVWGDLDPARTPQLWSLAEGSAIGAMSVRAGRSTSCLLDGWLTLGAGNRARFPGPAEPIPSVPDPAGSIDPAAPDGGASDGGPGAPAVDASLSYCGLQEQVADLGLHDPRTTLARAADDESTRRFGAEPGALGAAVGCGTVVGRAATLAVAGPGARLDVRDALPATAGETAGLLGGCPLTVVSLDQLTAGRPSPDPTDTGTDPGIRQAALATLDRQVGQLRAAVATLPGGTLLLLQGISEVNDGRPQLHLGLANGPGIDAGWLSSASTGRAPFVQLIDVAPTVLRALGIEQPASMNGQPITASGGRPALPAAIAELHDANVRATVHYRSTGLFFWTLVVVNAVVVAAGVLVLGGWGWSAARLRRRAAGRRWRPLLRLGCLAAAALPVATYLATIAPWQEGIAPWQAGIAPWQDGGAPRWALAGAVLVADVGVTAVAALGPWRRRRTGPALAVLAVTLATLVGDVLTGSHLELNGLLGYDAIVAGRFTGYGNLTFGLFSVSALLLTAAGTAALARRGTDTGEAHPARRRWLLPVLVAGLVCVVVIGAPFLGRDFGGVLAAVPGFLVLGMLLARIRVTAARLVAVLAAAVVVVAAVAVLDWLRPAADRTHLGRFVAQVLDGQAWTVIARKGEANLSILAGSPLAWILPVALVAGYWLLRPGGLLRSAPGRGPAGLPAADARVLRAGLIAVALSLTIGAAVNDSGVAVPATAATVLVPLLVWLVAGVRPAAGAEAGPAEGASGCTPDGDASRVSVSARGSTG